MTTITMITTHRSTLRLGAALLLGSAVLLASCGRGGDAPPAEAPAPKPALTVTTVSPQRASLEQTLAANGNLAAWQEAIIGAETGGQRLTEVRVNVGDRVKRGQVLATFARETVEAELAQARATVAEAEAAAAEAQANAQRARSLEATGALSAAQINQYVTAAQTAKARVQAAQAALEARRIRQGQTALVSPDDGIISARTATVGAVAGSGTELFRLIRDSRLEWRAQVIASELGRLKPGTMAEITASSGTRLEGKVRTIGPTVDPQTREALVYVDVKPVRGDEGHALPGMYARGVFALGSAPALTVPQGAVVLRDGFSYLMRVDGDSRIRPLKVQTGRVVGDRVEITSELPADLRIVASGGSFLNEGDRVRVVEAGDGTGTGIGAGAPGTAPNGTLAK